MAYPGYGLAKAGAAACWSAPPAITNESTHGVEVADNPAPSRQNHMLVCASHTIVGETERTVLRGVWAAGTTPSVYQAWTPLFVSAVSPNYPSLFSVSNQEHSIPYTVEHVAASTLCPIHFIPFAAKASRRSTSAMVAGSQVSTTMAITGSQLLVLQDL